MKDRTAILLDCFGLFVDDGFVLYFDRHYEPEESKRLKAHFCDGADIGTNEGLYPVVRMMGEELQLDPKAIHDEIISCSVVHPEMIDLANKLRQKHYVALLSNCMGTMLEEIFEGYPFDDCFDAQYRSYQVGMSKPHPEIYEYVLKQLSGYDRILFLDDNPINVDAAKQAGIEAYLFTSVTEAENLLHQLNLL